MRRCPGKRKGDNVLDREKRLVTCRIVVKGPGYNRRREKRSVEIVLTSQLALEGEYADKER